MRHFKIILFEAACGNVRTATVIAQQAGGVKAYRLFEGGGELRCVLKPK